MAESEINVIAHLLDVEQHAFLQIKEAQVKANSIVAEARSKADSEYNLQFEQISRKLEDEFEAEKKRIAEEHEKSIEEYKKNIVSTEKNNSAFSEFVKKALEA